MKKERKTFEGEREREKGGYRRGDTPEGREKQEMCYIKSALYFKDLIKTHQWK